MMEQLSVCRVEFSLDKKKVTFWINEVVNIEKKTINHINYKFIIIYIFKFYF